jgi:hypothetical protein
VGLTARCLIDGYSNGDPSAPGGPPAWYSDAQRPLFISKVALFGAQTILWEGLTVRLLLCVEMLLRSAKIDNVPAKVYRGYVVWGSVSAVAIPVLGLFGIAGVSISCP